MEKCKLQDCINFNNGKCKLFKDSFDEYRIKQCNKDKWWYVKPLNNKEFTKADVIKHILDDEDLKHKPGFWYYVHPSHAVYYYADWKIEPKKKLSEDEFYLVAIGNLTETEKKKCQDLVSFLKKYKIKAIEKGKTTSALSTNTMVCIKVEGKGAVVRWFFSNGRNGGDNWYDHTIEFGKMCKDLAENGFHNRPLVEDSPGNNGMGIYFIEIVISYDNI